MKKELRKALGFYLGKDFKKLSPSDLAIELNKKGFNLNTDMTLKEIFDILLERYRREYA